MSPKILCVEFNMAVRETRSAVLRHSGYDAVSAAPHLAESVLLSQKFDLVVLSMLCDLESHLIDGADILVLDGFTMPSELLSLVAQRLNRRQQRV
jgi:CheY-like chemotaxis protein